MTCMGIPGIAAIPCMAAPKSYQATDVKKLRMMAMTVMMRFVTNSAPA